VVGVPLVDGRPYHVVVVLALYISDRATAAGVLAGGVVSAPTTATSDTYQEYADA
jgi:hypothetical protein